MQVMQSSKHSNKWNCESRQCRENRILRQNCQTKMPRGRVRCKHSQNYRQGQNVNKRMIQANNTRKKCSSPWITKSDQPNESNQTCPTLITLSTSSIKEPSRQKQRQVFKQMQKANKSFVKGIQTTATQNPSTPNTELAIGNCIPTKTYPFESYVSPNSKET